jgi:SagB-type dehydrogenase family enzyme
MTTLTNITPGPLVQLKPNRVLERGEASLQLPAPEQTGGVPLMLALARRRSERDFSSSALPLALLSNLLWAAYGINRPETGGRTAPSALNAQQIDIYAALPGGLYIYDARAHDLRLVAEIDARCITGYQDFVDEAPLDLVYVADHAHTQAIPAKYRDIYAAASAGAIAQNVYLFCASNGLATVARGWFDRAALAAALGLGDKERIVLAQTVGYPRRA